MAWKKGNGARAIKRSQILLSLILLSLLVLVAFIVWRTVYSSEIVVDTEQIQTEEQRTADSETDSTIVNGPVYDAVALQTAVDDWVNATAGTSSVVVMTPDEDILAAHNADQVYFAASLYKLYVAYEGYRLLDVINEAPDTPYLDAYTREQCLDIMIRESHSPCAEKMWNEIGKLELTNTLREYGITNTSMVNISTTARDAAIILARIARGEGLNADAQAAYLDSLKTQEQIYRRGLPSGFSDAFTIYNKVGWNELVEWHDAAIVELPDRNQIIVTVLTENVGTASIRELAGSIEQVLSN